jgi:muramoyltetrapeptide carboxypeptidase
MPINLKPGDTVGIVSPSSPVAGLCPRRLDRGVKYLELLGYKVLKGKNVSKVDGFTAGTIQERVEDLHAMFANSEVKAIIATIGGYNANDLLDKLDYKMISKNNQKILIGYSDITILLHALYKKSGVKGIMGPMVLPQFAEFPKMQKFTKLSFSYVAANLGTGKMYKLPAAEEFTEEMLYWDKEDNRPRKMKVNKGWSIINHGQANGVLIPANLNTVSKLIGTEYMLDWTDTILFLEDDDEESAVTIQVMLQHLRQAGCLDKIKGIVFGRFQKESDIDEEKIHKILANVFGKIKFPVVANVDFGHTDPILSLPLGNEVFVNTEERKIEIKL